MPYLIAFSVWIGTTIILYLAAVYLILPRATTVILALTPVAVPTNIILGHNAFLTAGLLGLALVFLERRPWLAGVLLGLLTYKPQLGILIPLALLAARNWRAFASALVTSLALFITSALVFGYQAWPTFVGSLLDRTTGLSPLGDGELLLLSVYGLLQRAGTAAWLAWTAQLAVSSSLALAVWAVWARPIPYALQAALLAAATLLATPYVLMYDACILSIPVAFLVGDGLVRGFLTGERTLMLISLLLLCPAIAIASLGPIIDAILLFVVCRRILMLGQEPRATLPQDTIAGQFFGAL
jgi:hypothetical protein